MNEKSALQPIPASEPIVAAGVGNTSLQFSVFEPGDQRLPEPRKHHVFPIVGGDPKFEPPNPDDFTHWFVATVNKPSTERLKSWASEHGAKSFRILQNEEFPIEHDVRELSRVGSDRLAAAVGANALREEDRSAIFIDAGTALTVNAISRTGVFLGGAILPGAGTSLSALAKATAQLPQVELQLKNTDESPEAIGKYTQAAIRSGVYWGLVGAARQLILEMQKELGDEPQLFVTGGFGPWLSTELTGAAGGQEIAKLQFVPHLVLSGVALTARSILGK